MPPATRLSATAPGTNGNRRNTLTAYASMIFACAVLALLASAATADAGVDDYPSAWRNAPQDSTSDDWGNWNRECVSFVAWRLHARARFEMPFSANARDWGPRAMERGYAVDSTPAVGSVAWTPSNHVAWVEAVSGSNVELEDYNTVYPDGQTGIYHEHWEPTSTYQYIHFRDPGAQASGRPLAAGSHANGEQDVFWKGADGNLWEGFYAGGWHGANYVGMGPLGSSPTVAVTPTGEQDVFWRGTDGSLWEGWYANGHWNGPRSLGMGVLGSQPTATAWGSEVDVFWTGVDGGLWEAYSDAGGTWHGPTLVTSGPLVSAPTAAAHTNGEQDVFWKGTDAHLYQIVYANRHWGSPKNLGMGYLGSAPSATVRSTDEVDVFWKGIDGNLWQAKGSGSSWSGPTSRGMGVLNSAPSATAWGTEIDVFWRGGDADLWEGFANGTTWYGPARVGMGPITYSP